MTKTSDFEIVSTRQQRIAELAKQSQSGFADDAVIGLTYERNARRVLDVPPKRFGRYGLRLHPEKTRLVRFHRPPRRRDHKRPPPDRAPGTFELLGFTRYRGLSRKGNWVVKRKTAPSRLTRALRMIARWCRINRHRPIAKQHQTLSQKVSV